MNPYYDQHGIALYVGDCREVLPELPAETVHLTLTDPPYAAEFAWCWGLLAVQSIRLLVSGGSIVALTGQHHLPTAIAEFTRGGLRYWWVAGMRQQQQVRMIGKDVIVSWKPALWCVKEFRRHTGHYYPHDMIDTVRPLKQRHEWEQPLAWFRHWIERLTLREDVILDPFSGSGTTLIAARLAGRRAIGIDLEERHVEKTARELESTLHEPLLPMDSADEQWSFTLGGESDE